MYPHPDAHLDLVMGLQKRLGREEPSWNYAIIGDAVIFGVHSTRVVYDAPAGFSAGRTVSSGSCEQEQRTREREHKKMRTGTTDMHADGNNEYAIRNNERFQRKQVSRQRAF